MMEGTHDELKQSNFDYAKLLQSPVNTIDIHKNDSLSKINNNIDKKSSFHPIASSDIKYKFNEDRKKPIERLETRSSGSIAHNVYLSYFIAGGKIYKILLFTFICIFTEVLASSGNLWITYWYNLFTIHIQHYYI